MDSSNASLPPALPSARPDGKLASRFADTDARIAEPKAGLAGWTLAAPAAQTALLPGALKLL